MQTTGKRARPQTKARRGTKQFRAPRRRTAVIPGLLRQTATEKKVLFIGDNDPINGQIVFDTTGGVIPLNRIQVGSSMFNRIGRKIEMRSIRLVFHLYTEAVTRTTILPDLGRILIVYDRQTNGATPSIGDIIQDTDQAGTNTTEATSGLNMNNRERFVTIMDKKITLPQATCTAGVLTNVFPNDAALPIKFDEFRKLRGLTTHYKADSNPAVIGDIATGGLFLVYLSLLQAAGTNLFDARWNCRLKYVDV